MNLKEALKGEKEMKTVLISGKQGSGKTTLARALAQKWSTNTHHKAILMNFADPIYKMHDFIIGYLKEHGIDRKLVKDGPLLQLLGTEWGRKNVSENIWIDITKSKIAKANDPAFGFPIHKKLFIIGDCRFPNEIQAFPEALKVRLDCAKVVRKYRCSQWRENDTHESEIALDNFYEYDFLFNTESKSVDDCVNVLMNHLLTEKTIDTGKDQNTNT